MKLLLSSIFIFSLLLSYGQPKRFEDINWKFKKSGTSEWLDGNKQIDLFASIAKKNYLADPMNGGGDSLNSAIENSDWSFEKEFEVENTAEFSTIVLEGVDTYADVYVNDQPVLSCNNAFKGYEADLTRIIKKGVNRIRIDFHSPITRDLPQALSSTIIYPADSDKHPKKTSVFTRKPAYHFGWDFAPRRINFSIRHVEFEPAGSFKINGMRLQQLYIDRSKISRDHSTSLIISVVSTKKQNIELTAIIKDVHLTRRVDLKAGNNEIAVSLPSELNKWSISNDRKEQLFDVSVLCTHKNEVAKRTASLGTRDLTLNRTEDQVGERFSFYLNGKPFFAQGFNYIQTEQSVTEAEVKAWKDAGVNMIRVWGGGNYGDDVLYDLCDRYGILIWQDFMFANTMYPGDPNFIQNVKEEVIFQMKRLRHHPSLALWCGNNEIAVAWKNWGWQQTYKYSEEDSTKLINNYKALFDSIIPSLINEHDPGRYYISSSPISNWGKAEDFTIGDNHFWGVYHGEMPVEAYNDHIPRFASEYGMQSYPDIETLKEFIPLDSLTLSSWAVQRLQYSYKGNKLLDKYQEQITGKAKDLEDFIYKSQVVQAEAMKTAILAHRRNMDKCAGSMVWQWNDVAPAASWSMVDVKGRKKAAYHAAMKSFQPIVSSVLINGNEIEFWLISDLTPIDLQVEISVKNFRNEVLNKKSLSLQNVDSSNLILNTSIIDLVGKVDAKDLWIEVVIYSTDKKIVNSSAFYLAPLKDLNLPDPKLHYQLVDNGILVEWENHAPYLLLSLAGESYYPDPLEKSILLPFDHKLAGRLKARCLTHGSLDFNH